MPSYLLTRCPNGAKNSLERGSRLPNLNIIVLPFFKLRQKVVLARILKRDQIGETDLFYDGPTRRMRQFIATFDRGVHMDLDAHEPSSGTI